MTEARVLSIRQPYAELIVSGTKRVENRSWSTKYRGLVLIHAARQTATHGAHLHPDTPRLARRGIVGVAELVDVVSGSDDPWFSGPFGLVLENARRVPFASWRGTLALVAVPPDDVALLLKGKHPAQVTTRGASEGLFG